MYGMTPGTLFVLVIITKEAPMNQFLEDGVMEGKSIPPSMFRLDGSFREQDPNTASTAGLSGRVLVLTCS